MTYDTTLLDVIDSRPAAQADLPACLTRDCLTSPYFPSLTRHQLMTIVVLGSIFVVSSFARLPVAAWGNLVLGRWIVAHRQLPAVDPYLAAASPSRVLHTQWLTQVLSYDAVNWLGVDGLILGQSLLLTIAAAALLAGIRRRSESLPAAIIATVIAALLMIPAALKFDPAIAGLVGLCLMLLGLSHLPGRRWPLVGLPLTLLVWANAHESFVLGLLLLLTYAAGLVWRVCLELRDVKRAATDTRVVRVASAVALSVFAACINPTGPALLVKVFPYLKAAGGSLTDWRSLIFFGLVALAAACWKLSPRRFDVMDGLLVAASVLIAIALPAYIPPAALLVLWTVSPYAASWWQAKYGATAAAPSLAMNAVIALGFVFMALLISPPANQWILGRARGLAATSARGTPFYVADEVERRQLTGNLFAPADWADYLLWRSPEGLRALLPFHARTVRPAVVADYQRLLRGDAGWLDIVDRHALQYLVVSRHQQPSLAKAVVQASRGKLSRVTILYQDQQCLLAQVAAPGPASSPE